MGFTVKTDESNRIVRFKARLVALGFRQQYGVNYFDVSSPVMEKKSVRLLACIAVEMNWELHHIDIVSAYLNSELEEEIFMTPPKGSNIDPTYVCLLIEKERKWVKAIRQKLVSKCTREIFEVRIDSMY